MKKTRNCIEPWRSFQFEAGGSISPCCSGTISGRFGNIHTDYFAALRCGRRPDIFANDAYKDLRNGLLTGKLHRSCIDCRSVHDADVTPEALRKRVIHHLESQGMQTENLDLTREYAFIECGGNITNKCNFSCIYCSHSGTNGHAGTLATEMDREKFLDWIGFLCQRGLQIFNFCGIGEVTAYAGWQDLCNILLERHPRLRLRMISNFGKPFSKAEQDALAQFDMIHVSCDTLNEQKYAWLRKGGRLPVLLDNIHRIRARCAEIASQNPKLVFNVTLTEAVIDHLEDLFRFAAEHSMFVHLSTLFEMEGSVASRTNCVRKITDLDDSRILHIREVLCDLPRRMKAQNPLTNVWEYQFIYSAVMQRADAMTLNQFVPSDDEIAYREFFQSHLITPDAYLRKIWLSFDAVRKGMCITKGKTAWLEWPPAPGKLAYRVTWCRNRPDNNLDIIAGPIEEAEISGTLSVSAPEAPLPYNHMLFEVMSFVPVPEAEYTIQSIEPSPPADWSASTLIREAFLMGDAESIARRLVESQEPIALWCAGLRTMQLLSSTCLSRANIRMIIDGDSQKQGQLFFGKTVQSPAEIEGFSGKILVLHSSCPEQVELQIRNMGISNDILIL